MEIHWRLLPLKWALQREGRLTFNSNLRLLTSARTTKANYWYTNAVLLFCLIISYSRQISDLSGRRPAVDLRIRRLFAASASNARFSFRCYRSWVWYTRPCVRRHMMFTVEGVDPNVEFQSSGYSCSMSDVI
jgi:hypothetical protein